MSRSRTVTVLFFGGGGGGGGGGGREGGLYVINKVSFVKVFCLMQLGLVGLKYASNDGTTYARSLPNIKLNSVVPVASFRSMSALSPIHAAVILLLLKDWTCSIVLDLGMRQTLKEILGTNLCQPH